MSAQPLSEPIYVRVTPDMYKLIKKRAEKAERSINREVVYCLKAYLKQDKDEKSK